MNGLPAAFLAVLVSASAETSSPIVLVEGTYGMKAVPREAQGVKHYYRTVADCLQRAGLSFRTITDEEAARGKLPTKGLVILTYNPRLAPGEAERLADFVERGGKVVVFYSANRRLLDALGMRCRAHVVQKERGDFAALSFRRSVLPGAPRLVKQASWNILLAEPAGPAVKVAAVWLNREGKETGRPALLVGPRGAFFSHVLLADDPEGKVQMMLALVGRFLPGAWSRAVQVLLKEAREWGKRASRSRAASMWPRRSPRLLPRPM